MTNRSLSGLALAYAGIIAAFFTFASPGKGDPVTAPDKRYVISDFGAVGDGAKLNTKVIQAVIDRCAAAGGGLIVVPKGVFVTGSLFLQPGVNLQVEGVLKGSENAADYPWINTRIAGLEMKWPAALINADHADGLHLTGTGTIDGSGLPWWQKYWAAAKAETDRLDPHFKVPRPRLVHIINSNHIVVSDLLLKDSAFWHLQITYCDGVEIHGLRVRAPHQPVHAASSDGIDIDSTRNVLIEGCDIVCDDDAICLKSGRDADGLRVNRPTENVVIRNCHVGYAHGMVVFGSETSGGIRHVRVSNCRADGGCHAIVRFKTLMGRGGVVEDVVYDHIQADDVGSAMEFNMNALGNTWLPPEFRTRVPPAQGTPVIRNIIIQDLTVTHAQSAGTIVGLTQSPLRGIVLRNVSIEAAKGFTIANTRGLVFENVKLNGQPLAAPPADH
jgi:polygalacturonase